MTEDAVMQVGALCADAEVRSAWQAEGGPDWEKLENCFLTAPDDVETWSSGAWKTGVAAFLAQSQRAGATPPQLARLAKRAYETLWRRGRGPQPAWWRDVTIPAILTLVPDLPSSWADSEDKEESDRWKQWDAATRWSPTGPLPDGWGDDGLEPWLQSWLNGLLAFYRKYPEYRYAADRLGFYRSGTAGGRPAAYQLLTLRLLNRTFSEQIQNGKEICYVREIYGWLADQVKASGSGQPAHTSEIGTTWGTQLCRIICSLESMAKAEKVINRSCGNVQHLHPYWPEKQKFATLAKNLKGWCSCT